MPISPETVKSMHQVMGRAVMSLTDQANGMAINGALLRGLNEPSYANTFETVHALLATAIRKLATGIPGTGDKDTANSLDAVSLMTGESIILCAMECAQTFADSLNNTDLVKERVEGDMRDELEAQYRSYVDFVLAWKKDTDVIYAKSIKAMEAHGKNNS